MDLGLGLDPRVLAYPIRIRVYTTHYVATELLNALCRHELFVPLGHCTRLTVIAPRSSQDLAALD